MGAAPRPGSPRLAQARQEEHLAAARVFEVQHQTSARKQPDTTSGDLPLDHLMGSNGILMEWNGIRIHLMGYTLW